MISENTQSENTYHISSYESSNKTPDIKSQSIIEILPSELLQIIVESDLLDILDILNIKATCKTFNNLTNSNISYNKNIKFNLKDKKNITIKSLNDYVDIISSWLRDYKYQQGFIYMSQKITHHRLFKNIELRFTKNNKGRCTFTITDISHSIPFYSNIQVLYEPEYSRYRLSGLNNNPKKLIIPYLLLFIGFKVLFTIHGYNYIHTFNDINISYFDQKDIDKIPLWFKKIICCHNYNGMIFKDLIDGFVEVF